MVARNRGAGGAFTPLVFIVVLVWTLFPLLWAAAFSFKHSADFFGAKLVPWLQFDPTLANWREEWRAAWGAAGLGHELMTSMVVATGATAVSLILGLLAAVGLVRCEWHGTRTWPVLGLVLLPRVIPPVVVALPFSLLMHRVKLSDTDLALILAHSTLALPLTVLLLYSVVRELPAPIVEAAQVDGASWGRVLAGILVPLLRPALLAAGTLAFALSWNEFMFAVTNHQRFAATAPLAVASLESREGVQFEYVGSHLVLVLFPPLLLALATRRFVVRGLTLGAVHS